MCYFKKFYLSNTNFLKLIPEKLAINDALPLKAARRDAIAKLNFRDFEFELQTNSNAVSFRFTVGRHVNAAYRVGRRNH